MCSLEHIRSLLDGLVYGPGRLNGKAWEEYVGAEFDMRRAHSYRLLDQARVVQALREVAGEMSPMGDISERDARGMFTL